MVSKKSTGLRDPDQNVIGFWQWYARNFMQWAYDHRARVFVHRRDADHLAERMGNSKELRKLCALKADPRWQHALVWCLIEVWDERHRLDFEKPEQVRRHRGRPPGFPAPITLQVVVYLIRKIVGPKGHYRVLASEIIYDFFQDALLKILTKHDDRRRELQYKRRWPGGGEGAIPSLVRDALEVVGHYGPDFAIS